jgi:protein-S-isoprenylcysteine O-methyltransferase Ste14
VVVKSASVDDSAAEAEIHSMKSPYAIIAYCSWLVLGLVWLPGYFMSKNTANVPRLALQIPATVLLAIGFALLLTPGGRFLNTPVTPRNAVLGIVGVVLDLAGIGFAIWARLALGTNWSGLVVTTKEGHELIQSGPYAIVRHPIYAGMLLAMIGTALTLGTLTGYIGLAASSVAIMIRVSIEEKLMSDRFGEAYQTYRRRARKLVPFVW